MVYTKTWGALKQQRKIKSQYLKRKDMIVLAQTKQHLIGVLTKIKTVTKTLASSKSIKTLCLLSKLIRVITNNHNISYTRLQASMSR